MTAHSTVESQHLSACCSLSATSEPEAPTSDLPELLQHFRRRLETLQDVEGTHPATGNEPGGLALTIVAEALAIGEAISRITVEQASPESLPSSSPALYTRIDGRFVGGRTRALRSALHGVDDYVWWAGLTPTAG